MVMVAAADAGIYSAAHITLESPQGCHQDDITTLHPSQQQQR